MHMTNITFFKFFTSLHARYDAKCRQKLVIPIFIPKINYIPIEDPSVNHALLVKLVSSLKIIFTKASSLFIFRNHPRDMKNMKLYL
jgi:hypothetical protein